MDVSFVFCCDEANDCVSCGVIVPAFGTKNVFFPEENRAILLQIG